MKIYSDGIHIISNHSLNHLHDFCKSIGIKRCWFHSNAKFKHYDIPKRKRENFFKDNPDVIKVNSKELIKILKSLK